MSLDILNQSDKEQFLQLIGGPLEGEGWLAERVISYRPFADVNALMAAFSEVVTRADRDDRVQIIKSHPDLAVATDLSDTSAREQASVGLDQLSQAEFDAFKHLNTAYWEKFGFPFVICVREHDKNSILEHFRTRLTHSKDDEIETGVREVLKIIRLRTIDLLKTVE